MASSAGIAQGQRYRDVSPGVFGPSGLEWFVEALVTGRDGIAYAHLVSVRDPTQRKTLSASVLENPRRFQRSA